MNVNEYLQHIQVETGLRPNLQLLNLIHQRHLLTVPFENLDIHLQRPLSMDPTELFHKVVHRRRGGLCYEMNSLLYWVLTELGYEVDVISGQLWDEEGQKWKPVYSHLVLLVKCDGIPYLFDVGVGATFVYPLPVMEGIVTHDSLGNYQFIRPVDEDEDVHVLQREVEGAWTDYLRLSSTPRSLTEFQPMCTYYQTSPDSIFTQKKMCARLTSTGRVVLSDDALTITEHGEKIKTPIASEQEWEQALREHFGLE